jgi:uracil-DNA glycosylase
MLRPIIKIKPKYNPNWSVYEFATQCCPLGWESVFYATEIKEELKGISDQLDKEVELNGPYYPPKKDLFKALELTPLSSVRVLILGMDPYPGDYQGHCYAHGLAFSVDPSIPLNGLPGSLKNVFKEVQDNYPTAQMTSGSLINWATQGVLLLNASLTVRPGIPGSHKKLWAALIKAIIDKVKENEHVVFVFWGADAKKFESLVGNRCQKLVSGHPSPMSCKLFFGNKHFLKINAYFKHVGLPEIDWSTY